MDIKNDLYLDLMQSEYIINKCCNDIYAQNLYAAMCNNIFLKDNQKWTTTWRGAGRIVADIRNIHIQDWTKKEDYIDWYCSGLCDRTNYISEGCISIEIRQDLLLLGWNIYTYENIYIL